MKISTDAVVLGALASPDKRDRILDVGTGTGVIALMLAQRFPDAEIHGVEIDGDAFEQASANVSSSPWKHRVALYHQSFQDFARQPRSYFDLIVSNPPYFKAHIKSMDPKRTLALHNDQLSFGDLVQNVVKLLTPEGKFWVILPERQMQDLEKVAASFHLYTHESIELRNNPQARVLRVVAAFSFQGSLSKRKSLYIRDKDLNYSVDYKELLADFLLAF